MRQSCAPITARVSKLMVVVICTVQEDYYSPDNSYMNRVLERRQGLPITLSLVYMEVAKQVGLGMRGVQLPAHFMIAPDNQGLEILVDPFNGEAPRTGMQGTFMDRWPGV